MADKQSYNTKARRYIAEFLEANRESTVSATDIAEYLESMDVSVNIATVYRYLNRLTKEQRLLKFTKEDNQQSVYQLVGKAGGCHEHIHIKCTECGKLYHLECDFMHSIKHHLLKEHGFSLLCEGSILYGICHACSTKHNG